MTHCSLVVCLELSLSTPLPLLLGWKGQGFQVLRLSLHHAFLLLRRLALPSFLGKERNWFTKEEIQQGDTCC